MESFLEKTGRFILIMILGTVTMAVAFSFAVLMLQFTPMPEGFESGFALLALAMAGIIIGMFCGFSDFSVSNGFWYSELYAVILLIATHFVSGRIGLSTENMLVIFIAGLSGIVGAIIAKSFRKLLERIRGTIFKRRLL